MAPNTNDGVGERDIARREHGGQRSGSPLAAGRYCFRAEWPGDSNYAGPIVFTNDTDECFAVKDTSDISTAQSWVPNDSAHVTTGSGAAPAGTVTFTLYDSDDCTGDVMATFADRPIDSSGNASTNNSTTVVLTDPGQTVSVGRGLHAHGQQRDQRLDEQLRGVDRHHHGLNHTGDSTEIQKTKERPRRPPGPLLRS